MTTPLPKQLALAAGLTERFYSAARGLEFHAFLEFSGLMREFLNICRDNEGQDPGASPDAWVRQCRPYQAAYLGEKMECIFGRMLRDPECRAAFEDALFRAKTLYGPRGQPRAPRNRTTGDR